MGVFDFLKPKKQIVLSNPLNIYSSRLSVEERASVYGVMLFMMSQKGRKHHPEELRYIDTMRVSVLDLTDQDLKTVEFRKIDIFGIVNNFSISDKERFASMFFGLVDIIHDQLILKAANVIIGDMGFKLEDVARKYFESVKEMEANPGMRKLLGK